MPGQGGNIFAENAETGEQVGAVQFEGNMQGGYSWEVGYNNPLVKIESDGGENNSGGNNGNNMTVSQCIQQNAQKYLNWMKDPANTYDPCQQVWSFLGTWEAYHCEYTYGNHTASEKEELKLLMNQCRQNLLDIGYNGTKCGGSVPPKM